MESGTRSAMVRKRTAVAVTEAAVDRTVFNDGSDSCAIMFPFLGSGKV